MPARQVLDYALDIQHRQRVDAGERLIEQDEPRLGRQRARDLDPPALAARQAMPQAVAHMADVQLLEQLLEALLAPARPARAQSRGWP
jgi:hypothetical protein